MIGQVRTNTTIRTTQNTGKTNNGYACFIDHYSGTIKGLPCITDATTTNIKVTDTITVEFLGISACDWISKADLEVALSVVEGMQAVGEIMTISATVVDEYGNTDVRYYDLKVYGTPTIEYECLSLSLSEITTIGDVLIPVIVPITVRFDSNGGSPVDLQIITESQGIVYPENPVKAGYIFKGWYIDIECTQLFDFCSLMSEDMILYAGWEEIKTPYSSYTYIDVSHEYNTSSSLFSFNTSSTTSDKRKYVFFTALEDGNYTLYYRRGFWVSNIQILQRKWQQFQNGYLFGGSHRLVSE